jgi:transposase
MKLVKLLQIALSEEGVEEFLRTEGVLKTFDSCPFCNGKKIGKVRKDFFKCYGCKKR